MTRHASGDAVVVGDDLFAVLADELAAGAESTSGSATSATPAAPTCRAPIRGGPVPDAVWMRPGTVRLFDHEAEGAGGFEARSARTSTTAGGATPAEYRAAFDRVQEHLHAGNTYEVNLTYRDTITADLEPAEAYLRLRALNPAPYAGFLQHDVPDARGWLLSSTRSATRW